VDGQHGNGGCAVTVTCPVCEGEWMEGAIADCIREAIRCPHCNAELVVYEEEVRDGVWEIQTLVVVEQ
jgi:predicted Zn-ribbon and HTH transcriptional regulator